MCIFCVLKRMNAQLNSNAVLHVAIFPMPFHDRVFNFKSKDAVLTHNAVALRFNDRVFRNPKTQRCKKYLLESNVAPYYLSL